MSTVYIFIYLYIYSAPDVEILIHSGFHSNPFSNISITPLKTSFTKRFQTFFPCILKLTHCIMYLLVHSPTRSIHDHCQYVSVNIRSIYNHTRIILSYFFIFTRLESRNRLRYLSRRPSWIDASCRVESGSSLRSSTIIAKVCRTVVGNWRADTKIYTNIQKDVKYKKKTNC